jgi:dTDP-4-amino-4,6-dideoxygalactose transaminase
LDAKLPHLNEYIASRQKAASFYDNAFRNNGNLLVPAVAPYSTHVYHQYTLRLSDRLSAQRDTIKERLAEKGIPAMVYYPVPLHMQKAYQDPRYHQGDFPVAERLASCVLSLPIHTCLDEEQLSWITSNVLQLCKD